MHLPARLMKRYSGIGLITALILTSGCDDPQPAPQPEPVQQQPTPVSAPITAESLAALETFRRRSTELLDGLVVCTETLETLGEQFLQQTDTTNLEAVQAQWQACFDLYRASTLLRGFTQTHRQALQAARNNLGQPLVMPGFIDRVSGYPYSGIVNDASLLLDESNLRQQHGLTDETEVSIGFSVVAFLLWGEQRQQPELPARPVTDYEPATLWDDGFTDLPIEAHPNNRRRHLLELALRLLTKDSQALRNLWQSGEFPSSETAAEAWRRQQIQAMLTALEQQPDNTQVSTHLAAWLADGAIPGLPPATDAPSADQPDPLRQQLSRALESGAGQRVPTEPG